ncbi:pyrroline-5-carboxylate reductase [Jatrophihabitans telluris]|uniref:Pyrroline-5-carboxylate reductase n=1 Tax=Jatrophihabitans telluris TaxID=2038343 RepID=A0ABY4R168_9ACTN|nr:pyrroline-5-carboxylate reductase [Jatrophihabitans telluris]UQX88861.1 pyrroline-5-carboxylate reductase [Jatrophihabitans telluris]
MTIDSTIEKDKLAIVGGGKIGEALLSGLLRTPAGGQPRYRPEDVVVVEHYPDRRSYLSERYGVEIGDVARAAGAGTIVIAVKPQDIDTVLAELAPLATADHLVVSVAAGITTNQLERGLPGGPAVVRCMPNTPALVDQAMTAISAGAHADESHLQRAQELLEAVGRVVRVPESQLDAVTALSGSGPAYFFFLVEAMIDAGILLGLPRTLAAELIVQTAVGAAVMLRDTGEHPVQLREAVTSPGGTTISAIRELEIHGVRAALIAAIEAARDRSVELGRASNPSG